MHIRVDDESFRAVKQLLVMQHRDWRACLAWSCDALPPPWFFVAMIPISLAGTWAGGLVLDRLSDVHFKTLTRWFVTVIGLGYLLTAARLFLSH